MQTVIIASGNKGKLKEFQELMKDLPVEVRSLADYPEILNKFVLLLNAGMNTRKALGKVAHLVVSPLWASVGGCCWTTKAPIVVMTRAVCLSSVV